MSIGRLARRWLLCLLIAAPYAPGLLALVFRGRECFQNPQYAGSPANCLTLNFFFAPFVFIVGPIPDDGSSRFAAFPELIAILLPLSVALAAVSFLLWKPSAVDHRA